MANLPGLRIRENGAFGTITDNPLSVGAVTFNSPGLANLRAIASDHAIIVLDPLRQSGASEIIMVTAHASAATVATIQRGMFGTIPRSHAINTLWVNSAIDDDFIRTVTSSTRPSDTFEGQVIYEADTNNYKTWDGSSWINFGGLPIRMGWHLTRVANQSIPVSGSPTDVSWDTEVQDIPANFTAPGTTLTVPTGGDGLWQITYQLDYGAALDTNSISFIRLIAGGFTFKTYDSDDVTTAAAPSLNLGITVPLVATNTIIASVQHGAVAAQNVTGRLLAYRIGA